MRDEQYKQTDTVKKWLTVEDVATLLQVQKSFARRKMREMQGCVNIGSQKYQQLRVSQSSLDAWIKNHHVIL